MCLGVPGRVVEWIDRESIMAPAWIEFDGLRKECSLACVPEAEVGDFVIIHAGVAICRIDADRAAEMLTLLRQMDAGYLDELDAPP
jgi:hydrogenase expression/formation protein HypC